MERLSEANLERYIVLNNELAVEDPYVLKITKSEFLQKHMEEIKSGLIDIFILCDNKKDIGFVELSKEGDTAIIEEIYVRKQYSNNNYYKSILEFVNKYFSDTIIKKVKFIGVNDKAHFMKALKDNGFKMDKEHIQMEKSISKIVQRDLKLDYKTFHEIGNKNWIYNFMKECMKGSIFNYTLEEINELTHINSDLAIVCYERNQPIGFIISNINEKRNKQENKNVIYIEEIAVLKEFRNKGYGFMMLEFILNKGKINGMDIARLHVYRHNESAHRLYKKMGFKNIKSIGHWIKIL